MSEIVGKNAARADSTLKFVERSVASASRISGRWLSSSEGRPGDTRGTVIRNVLPPAAEKCSGARPTSTASAAMFWRSVISSGGIAARWVATRLSCWETSSCEAVPALKRSLIRPRMRLEAAKFSRAMRSLSCELATRK